MGAEILKHVTSVEPNGIWVIGGLILGAIPLVILIRFLFGGIITVLAIGFFCITILATLEHIPTKPQPVFRMPTNAIKEAQLDGRLYKEPINGVNFFELPGQGK